MTLANQSEDRSYNLNILSGPHPNSHLKPRQLLPPLLPSLFQPAPRQNPKSPHLFILGSYSDTRMPTKETEGALKTTLYNLELEPNQTRKKFITGGP